MQITVQVIDGCPYRALAQQRLREALRDGAGTPIFVTVEEIVDEDHCRRIGFRGSPTFLIDGRDPFVEGTQVIGLDAASTTPKPGATTHPASTSSEEPSTLTDRSG